MKKSLLLMLTFLFLVIFTLTSCEKILPSSKNDLNNNDTADDYSPQLDDVPEEIKEILKLSSSEGLEFTLNKDKNAYTLTSIGVCINTDIVIPSSYLGLPITSIDSNVFANYTALTNIVIPDSVIKIPENAFKGCSNLTNVVLGNGITKIAKNAFYDCYNLKNVLLGNSIVEIEDNAFHSCLSLEYIRIPNSIQKMGTIFSTYNNIDFNKYEGGNYLGNKNNPYLALISVENETLTTYKIHSNTQIIYPSVFKSCENLIAINIPDNVTYISDALFENCIRLGGITLGKNISYIGNSAFSGCSSLKQLSLPNSVTKIENNAFYSCTNLSNISIPDSVTYIGKNAFTSCNKLTSITIPKNIEHIEDNTFDGCSQLTEITLPNSIISIGKSAFKNCTNLGNINIPTEVSTIGESAFENCYSLNIVYFNAMSMGDFTYSSQIFKNAGMKSKEFKIFIGKDVNKIPAYLFYGYNSYLRDIEFEKNSSCASIGNYAFYNCDFLTCIIIPRSVLSIGTSAYVNCDSVTDIYYGGTKNEWARIRMVDYVNEQKVTLHFNCDI